MSMPLRRVYGPSVGVVFTGPEWNAKQATMRVEFLAAIVRAFFIALFISVLVGVIAGVHYLLAGIGI